MLLAISFVEPMNLKLRLVILPAILKT